MAVSAPSTSGRRRIDTSLGPGAPVYQLEVFSRYANPSLYILITTSQSETVDTTQGGPPVVTRSIAIEDFDQLAHEELGDSGCFGSNSTLQVSA